MSKKYVFQKLIWWLITCCICAVALLWVFSKSEEKSEAQAVVLTLWNVDTFEGGKGSRTSFLGKIAAAYEKQNEGLMIMVSSRSIEGAKTAIESGELPDMISFGSYFPYIEPIGEPCVWCEGRYILYSLQEDFSPANLSNTVISQGGNNQPLVAAALYGFTGTPKVEESTTAYVKFLNGNYAYLLGTQRDACRFTSRGVQVYAKLLEEFSDLQHSIALLKTENKKACEGFIRYLLSEKSQKLVSSIGMFSPEYDIYSVDDILHDAIEKSSCRYTVSPFMDDRVIEEMQNAAQAALRGENKEVLKNFLKVS